MENRKKGGFSGKKHLCQFEGEVFLDDRSSSENGSFHEMGTAVNPFRLTLGIHVVREGGALRDGIMVSFRNGGSHYHVE